ncbi:MAG: hypothetical protein BM565_06855 [Gammaproteobacteria bacterium MedPE]|nr:MAG: hypothetical protein BM565_06855 [Gammaproteobacteria bacterium MedPE]
MNSTNKWLLVILMVSTSGVYAADKPSKNQVIKLKDTIIGSKEQPRFISIVPWKRLNSPVISVNQVHKSQFDNLRRRSIESMKKQSELASHLLGRKPQ